MGRVPGTWEKIIHEDYMADKKMQNRPVFGAYTSGSTGISKLVIHSSANVVAAGIPDVHLYSAVRCTGKMVAANLCHRH